MGFEQFEEIAGLRQKLLKPGEHRTYLGLFGDDGEQAPAAGGFIELGGVEGADQVGEIGFLDRLRGVRQAEPSAGAFARFLPFGQLLAKTAPHAEAQS